MSATQRTPKAKGFTLLEMIVSIGLLGLVGMAFVMCLVYATQSYVTARDATALTQKAHLALTRMYVELAEIQGIDSGHAGSIDDSAFYFSDHNGQASSLVLNNGEILLGGNTLVDGLASYSGGQALFTYVDENGSTWTTADGFDDLFEIQVQLRMQGLDGSGTSSFNMTVNPRKTTKPSAPKMD